MTSHIKCVLIDLSGTIHIDNDEIPGSIEALVRLRNSELKMKFVTNTTKESKRVLLERLNTIGFRVSKDELFTSLSAAHSLVVERDLHPMLLLDRRAMEDFEDISTDNPNAVVVGLAPDHFNFMTLTTAFRIIHAGSPLIAIHKGRYYKTQGNLSLGPGPFVTALEYATGATAEVVGKPEKQFFLSAIKDTGCQPDDCVMIGDDARDDVGGAQAAGMTGILVKTGKYRDGDERKCEDPPRYIVANFSHAVDVILKLTSQQSSS